MTARAGTDENKPVDPGANGAAGMADIGHVMKHHAAIAVHRIHHFAHGAERGDDQRHLVVHADFQIGLNPGIAAVNDQIDTEGGRPFIAAEGRFYLFQPGFETFAAALIERRKGAENPGSAAGDHQFRPRSQKHRRGDDGQGQPAPERIR